MILLEHSTLYLITRNIFLICFNHCFIYIYIYFFLFVLFEFFFFSFQAMENLSLLFLSYQNSHIKVPHLCQYFLVQ